MYHFYNFAFVQVYHVAVDFAETAKLYGRVIIVEQYLPVRYLTNYQYNA